MHTDTVDVVAASGTGDGAVAGGGVKAQLQNGRDGDALHTQVKVATGFAEGKHRSESEQAVSSLVPFKLQAWAGR